MKVPTKKSDLRDFVSEELRKVLDEEDVSYNWRRRPAQDQVVSDKMQEAEKPKEASAPSSSSAQRSSSAQSSSSAQKGMNQIPLARGNYATSEKQETKRFRNAASSAVSSSGYSGSLVLQKVKSGAPGCGAQASEASAVVNLDSVQQRLPERLRLEDVKPMIRLVAYDGGQAMLSGGPLSISPGEKRASPQKWLLTWLEGECSTKLMSLAADSWLHEMDSTSRELPALALIAGLLADPSLEHFPPSLLEYLASPRTAASRAVRQVVEAAQLEDEELLASQVEVALGRLESSQPSQLLGTELLMASVRREILRFLWCSESFEFGSSRFTDEWILMQLRRSPQAAEEDFQAASEAMLQAENSFLDRYLIRLLKLKRSLVTLLDAWEKVDHYAILGVSRSATDKELRNAYRRACLRLHPDKGGDKQQFQQLQDSYARILEEREKDKEAKQGVAVPASGLGSSSNIVL